jgi:hypothetical protein
MHTRTVPPASLTLAWMERSQHAEDPGEAWIPKGVCDLGWTGKYCATPTCPFAPEDAGCGPGGECQTTGGLNLDDGTPEWFCICAPPTYTTERINVGANPCPESPVCGGRGTPLVASNSQATFSCTCNASAGWHQVPPNANKRNQEWCDGTCIFRSTVLGQILTGTWGPPRPGSITNVCMCDVGAPPIPGWGLVAECSILIARRERMMTQGSAPTTTAPVATPTSTTVPPSTTPAVTATHTCVVTTDSFPILIKR